MATKFSTFFSLTLLILFQLSLSTALDSSYFKSPRGQLIKYDDLRKRLTLSTFANEDIRKLLYEVTKDHNLYHDDKMLDLQKETSETKITSTNRKRLVDNESSADIFYRSGSKFSYAYTANGRVFALSKGNIKLIPLNQKKYPGIFLNRHSQIDGDRTVHLQRNIDFTSEEEELLMPSNKSMSSDIVHTTRASCSDSNVKKEIEVAIAFDHTFCEDYESSKDAKNAISVMISEASKALESKTCLYLKVVYLGGTCSYSNDPYQEASQYIGDETSKSFTSMRDSWKALKSHVQSDITLFYVGYSRSYEYIALGYVGKTCSDEQYAWINGESNIHTAHRIGRLLGAPFDESSQNIMNRNPEFSSPLIFTDISANGIISYIDSNVGGKSKCIQDVGGIEKFAVCEGGFSNTNAMDCQSGRIGSISTDIGSIEVSIEQTNGRFDVAFEAPARTGRLEYYFSSYRRALSMDSSLTYDQLAPDRTPSAKSNYIVSRWDTSEVNKVVTDTNTCCDEILYIHIYIGLERHELDTSGNTVDVMSSNEKSVSLPWKVSCASCPSSSYIPMGSSRRCPAC